MILTTKTYPKTYALIPTYHTTPPKSLYATKWRHDRLDTQCESLSEITCRTPSKLNNTNIILNVG